MNRSARKAASCRQSHSLAPGYRPRSSGQNHQMTDTATCEHCNARCRVTAAHIGKTVSCPKCKNRFVVRLQGTPVNGPSTPAQPPVQPAPPPPPIENGDLSHETVPQFVTRNKTTVQKKITGPSLALPAFTTTLGIGSGCVIGYFAAHHFAFFGGFALLGQPYSPARSSLVPGHMLLCGILLGLLGLGLGVLFVRLAK